MAVTADIALLAAAAEDLNWTLKEGNVVSWAGDLVLGLLMSPLWGILFGFVGALLFLGAGFLFVRGERPRSYALAGAIAGLAHSSIGLIIAREPSSSAWLNNVALWGGFWLTSSPRWIVVVATFPASMAGGVIAGAAYARILHSGMACGQWSEA